MTVDAQDVDGLDVGADSGELRVGCAIDEGPEQLLLTTSGHGKWVCLDGGASRSTSNCATDFLQMTNARGAVRTAAGVTLVQKGTIVFVVKAKYQGQEVSLSLILPNKNKVKAQPGETTTRLLGEFDLKNMGFRDCGEQDDGSSLWKHEDGYEIRAQFRNRIKSVECEQVDSRSNKLPPKLKKRFVQIANAGGGFIIDPRQVPTPEQPEPVNVVTRRGAGIDVPSATSADDSPPGTPARRVGGGRVGESPSDGDLAEEELRANESGENAGLHSDSDDAAGHEHGEHAPLQKCRDGAAGGGAANAAIRDVGKGRGTGARAEYVDSALHELRGRGAKRSMNESAGTTEGEMRQAKRKRSGASAGDDGRREAGTSPRPKASDGEGGSRQSKRKRPDATAGDDGRQEARTSPVPKASDGSYACGSRREASATRTRKRGAETGDDGAPDASRSNQGTSKASGGENVRVTGTDGARKRRKIVDKKGAEGDQGTEVGTDGQIQVYGDAEPETGMTSRAKKWVTTFQLLRRMMAPWKRMFLTVFGAPGYVTLTKLELKKFFPKRCMKLGQRGILAYFVGKPDLMSPTLWVAVEGKKWKVLRVSWTQWRALEDDYIKEERDSVVFPDGRREDLEIVHGEHEMRPPTGDAEDRQPGRGAPAGRPRGWTPECGLSYAEFRQRQEIDAEMSTDEDDVMLMEAPTKDAVHGKDHVLASIDYDADARQSLASRSIMRAATNGRLHEPTTVTMMDDLHATTEGWAEHVARQIQDARPYVCESERLTDRQRMQLPDPKNPVEVLLAEDWAEMCLATQREVTGFKENAVFVVRRKAEKYPKKLGRLLEIWSRKFEDGKFKRCKFRAVVDGRTQKLGKDCRPNVFWPTPASATIKLLFAWSSTAMRRAKEARLPRGTGKVRSADLSTFFLQSPVDEEYGGHCVAIPGSFILAEGTVDEWAAERARLIKIRDGPDGATKLKAEAKTWTRKRGDEYYESQQMIYGDRAASARSGERLTGWVISIGYTQSAVDPCFFFLVPKVIAPELVAALTEELEQHLADAKRYGRESGESAKRQKKRAQGLKELAVPPINEVHKLIIHVDDLAHGGKPEDMDNFETALQKAFKVGTMGECKSFNGMTIVQDDEACTVTMSQPNLLEKLEAEHGHYWHGTKVPKAPLPPGTKLEARATDEEYAEAKHLPFASIVSTLAYGARMTMLQIGLAVALLSRHMAKHNKEQFELLVQCAHYAYETRNVGITFCGYGNDHDDQLTATADASFGDRCVLAHYLKMNGAAFDHSIASNKTVMLSTTEAELNAAARCGRAVMGYRNLMEEMPGHYRQTAATPVEGDCGPCITICNNPGALSEATRHMRRSAMYMRELVCHHLTAYTWTPTRFLQADAGTKVLTTLMHQQHLAELNGTAQAASWKKYKFHQTAHKPYETMLARDEQQQRRTEAEMERKASRGGGQKRKTDHDKVDNATRAGGGRQASAQDVATGEEPAADSGPDRVNFVNFARLKAKEKSLLQAQIMGFMGNAKLTIVQDCMRGFEYPGGIQNHSFLAKLRAGFPKKTQKNLRDDDEPIGRRYEPCEHLCVDSFELSVRTIHGGRHVYLFTDAKCSKKRWALLARSKAQYPRVLIRLLGKVRALGWEVKCLRTDGAGEMVGEPARQVMDQHAIALEESSPHRPEENGSSERAVRAITEKARALMLNAPHLPASAGGLAVLHASALLEFQPFQIDVE